MLFIAAYKINCKISDSVKLGTGNPLGPLNLKICFPESQILEEKFKNTSKN